MKSLGGELNMGKMIRFIKRWLFSFEVYLFIVLVFVCVGMGYIFFEIFLFLKISKSCIYGVFFVGSIGRGF